MEDIQVNNNVQLEELHDGFTWIHGKSNENIQLTIFLITICSEQLQYSLQSINELKLTHNVYVNVIMNVSPTNKAYNEMRLRCTTDYFVQNDEDMELYPDSLNVFYKYINQSKSNIYLHKFKLIDTCLGNGSPPIIDCLKLYNNNIMKYYSTYMNGEEAVSSVDNLWHTQLSERGYADVDTKHIIGFHGNHRTDFDLMIRHCKIISSIMDKRIKTNSGHICKLLRSLCRDKKNLKRYFRIIINHFLTFTTINEDKLNHVLQHVNGFVRPRHLRTYNIEERYIIPNVGNIVFDYEQFFSLFEMNYIDREQFFCIVGIMCIATDNYAYSKDKYPYDIYEYFNDILTNKKNILFLDKIDMKTEYNFTGRMSTRTIAGIAAARAFSDGNKISMVESRKRRADTRVFVRSGVENIIYDTKDNLYMIRDTFVDMCNNIHLYSNPN